ncbi:unnamed protein product, partial [Amoebophrya sp. A25]|eukprot:GSA25T00002054001.1
MDASNATCSGNVYGVTDTVPHHGYFYQNINPTGLFDDRGGVVVMSPVATGGGAQEQVLPPSQLQFVGPNGSASAVLPQRGYSDAHSNPYTLATPYLQHQSASEIPSRGQVGSFPLCIPPPFPPALQKHQQNQEPTSHNLFHQTQVGTQTGEPTTYTIQDPASNRAVAHPNATDQCRMNMKAMAISSIMRSAPGHFVIRAPKQNIDYEALRSVYIPAWKDIIQQDMSAIEESAHATNLTGGPSVWAVLSELSLQENALGDHGVAALLHWLRTWQIGCKVLKVYDNGIGDYGATFVALFLRAQAQGFVADPLIAQGPRYPLLMEQETDRNVSSTNGLSRCAPRPISGRLREAERVGSSKDETDADHPTNASLQSQRSAISRALSQPTPPYLLTELHLSKNKITEDGCVVIFECLADCADVYPLRVPEKRGPKGRGKESRKSRGDTLARKPLWLRLDQNLIGNLQQEGVDFVKSVTAEYCLPRAAAAVLALGGLKPAESDTVLGSKAERCHLWSGGAASHVTSTGSTRPALAGRDLCWTQGCTTASNIKLPQLFRVIYSKSEPGRNFKTVDPQCSARRAVSHAIELKAKGPIVSMADGVEEKDNAE